MMTLALADVKNRFSEVVANVQHTHEQIMVTKNGLPAAVIVSPDDLESLRETIEVLSDSDLMRQLAESYEDLAAGQVFSADELAQAMAARRAIEQTSNL